MAPVESARRRLETITPTAIIHISTVLPGWRNWQTRQVEGLVPVKGVQVQVLSPALDEAQGYSAQTDSFTKPATTNRDNPPTLGALKKQYLESLFIGAVEANSLDTVAVHLRHFVRTLTVDFRIRRVSGPRRRVAASSESA